MTAGLDFSISCHLAHVQSAMFAERVADKIRHECYKKEKGDEKKNLDSVL